MKFVVFGLTVTSSWGNGHATLWRALLRAMVRRGHRVTFFERDQEWYASARDLTELHGVSIVLYPGWASVQARAAAELADADVAMVTSYCPDSAAACGPVLSSRAVRVFYDLDTPVTLDRLLAGEAVDYVPSGGFGDFDLALSYTGGGALRALRERLGARRVAPLYGSVDPAAHFPVPAEERLRADLSYLGTYAADRQAALKALFVEPARRMPDRRFVIGGSQYPADFPWAENIYFVRHMPPPEHPAFFASSRLTLNVTRKAMAEYGHCPSGRLFEAAACGAPVLSDWWEGLDAFYTPGREILIARTTEDAVAAVATDDAELRRIARAARDRTLAEHTADHRVLDLEAALESVREPEEA
ncbi:glycosyltransferase [Roseomonas sp. CCTCC AB2023176]|uniref:CgeB family protein n=1 Tax=Roseomonas sp. CCTCC AB2023176 TaxID=3342640 RepID=UPI0035D7EE2B